MVGGSSPEADNGAPGRRRISPYWGPRRAVGEVERERGWVKSP